MKINELIEKRIDDKLEFNLMELESELGLKLDKKEKIKLLDSLISDDRLVKFFICVCPDCSIKNNDGLFNSELLDEKKQCFSCKKKYTMSMENTILIFDPKKLTERFKSQ